jgi:tripartite-type tricarboxylate transporter receptor subunit TctC
VVKARIAELSSEIVPMDKVTPESLRTLLTSETQRWGKVIRAAGVQAE